MPEVQRVVEDARQRINDVRVTIRTICDYMRGLKNRDPRQYDVWRLSLDEIDFDMMPYTLDIFESSLVIYGPPDESETTETLYVVLNETAKMAATLMGVEPTQSTASETAST
jgi:uncharacterized Fe-S cluster-containing protein